MALAGRHFSDPVGEGGGLPHPRSRYILAVYRSAPVWTGSRFDRFTVVDGLLGALQSRRLHRRVKRYNFSCFPKQLRFSCFLLLGKGSCLATPPPPVNPPGFTGGLML